MLSTYLLRFDLLTQSTQRSEGDMLSFELGWYLTACASAPKTEQWIEIPYLTQLFLVPHASILSELCIFLHTDAVDSWSLWEWSTRTWSDGLQLSISSQKPFWVGGSPIMKSMLISHFHPRTDKGWSNLAGFKWSALTLLQLSHLTT